MNAIVLESSSEFNVVIGKYTAYSSVPTLILVIKFTENTRTIKMILLDFNKG